MTPITIGNYSSGLTKNKKPFLIADEAFQDLENSYVWRDRTKKREGLKLLGRLRRFYAGVSLGNSAISVWTFNIYSTVVPPITPEANAQIDNGSVVITIQAGPNIVFTDQGNGTLTSPTLGNSGVIDYTTGIVILTHTAGAGIPVIITFGYFPSLPVQGIWQREVIDQNNEETIFFDTSYAYKFVGTGFQEFITGTTWNCTDADFFLSANFPAQPQSASFAQKYMFVTNYVNNSFNPMRYTDGLAWTDFYPVVSETAGAPNTRVFITSAKILIPYYGRLLALNVWESAADGAGNPVYGGSVLHSNRCRFSQIGNPLESTVNDSIIDVAWRSDKFGKGGFIDAPIAEDIIYAVFYKNTLIVGFERSTWQLRYVGEYGIPFIWERISSDFGGQSPFAAVLFDSGIATIGDRAIVSSNSISVDRIDLQIPDQVFEFQNTDSGPQRVQGVRNYKREIVYWNYPEMQRSSDALLYKFPNKVLAFNYRNNTYAVFRDNVTCFGIFQPQINEYTWDRLDIFWEDDTVTWDDINAQSENEVICCGNQQGFVNFYAYILPDDVSLAINAVDLTGINLTIIDHNLEAGEIIKITGMNFADANTFIPVATTLNDQIYVVYKVIDKDTIQIGKWDFTLQTYLYQFTFSPSPLFIDTVYIGGGLVTLLPKMRLKTKDFNPYMAKGLQMKMNYVDFLVDTKTSGIVSINLYLDTSQVKGNLLVGNVSVQSAATSPFYLPNSNISWHRFFANTVGQFVSVEVTYNDDLMNTATTHYEDFTLNAMIVWTREGGKNVF